MSLSPIDMSKSALKNKCKREAQKRSKQDQKGDSPSSSSNMERDELLATTKYLLQDGKPPPPTTTQPSDTEKKLKILRKVCVWVWVGESGCMTGGLLVKVWTLVNAISTTYPVVNGEVGI